MIRPLVQQAIVALKLPMVGGVEDIGVVGPAPCRYGIEHATAGFVDQLVRDVDDGIHFSEVVLSEATGDNAGQTGALKVGTRAVVPGQPMTRLLAQHLSGLFRSQISLGKIQVPPVHPMALRRGRIPRMVRVGEAHPAKPVAVVVKRVEPSRHPLGHPLGVVELPGHRVVHQLGNSRVAAKGGIQGLDESGRSLRVVLVQPLGVVVHARRSVDGQLSMVESPIRTSAVFGGQAVLGEPKVSG